MTTAGTFQGQQKAAPKLRRDKFAYGTGPLDKIPLILFGADKTLKYDWRVKSDNGTVTPAVGHLLGQKADVLVLQFVQDPADQSLAAPGTADAPVRIFVDPKVVNRRARYTVSVTKANDTGIIDTDVLFVIPSSNSRDLTDAQAPIGTDAGLQARHLFWTGKEPADQNSRDPEANKFAGIGNPPAMPSPSYISWQNTTGKQLAPNKRIFLVENPVEALLGNYGVTSSIPIYKRKTGAGGAPLNEWEFKGHLVQGTAITGFTLLRLDLDDQDMIVGHEQRHVVEDFAEMTDTNNLIRKVMLHLYNQFFSLNVQNQTEANEALYLDAARAFKKEFGEVLTHYQDLVNYIATGSKYSNHVLSASHVAAWTLHYNQVNHLLEFGWNGPPGQGRIRITDPGLRTGTAQSPGIILVMQQQYDNLPAVLSDLKGGKRGVGANPSFDLDPNRIKGAFALRPHE